MNANPPALRNRLEILPAAIGFVGGDFSNRERLGRLADQRHELRGIARVLVENPHGRDPGIARQSAFQFLKSGDPRISMLRRLAKASGMALHELVSEERPTGRRPKTKA
jgi:hypothetical protein